MQTRARPEPGLASFLQDFTSGATNHDMRRLFARDATLAYRVLTRDQNTAREPAGLTLQPTNGAMTGGVGCSLTVWVSYLTLDLP